MATARLLRARAGAARTTGGGVVAAVLAGVSEASPAAPGRAGWSGTGRTREDAPCPLASRSLRRGGDDPVSVENGVNAERKLTPYR